MPYAGCVGRNSGFLQALLPSVLLSQKHSGGPLFLPANVIIFEASVRLSVRQCSIYWLKIVAENCGLPTSLASLCITVSGAQSGTPLILVN